jgi:glycine/D-amino acid oxidase-like deaminating enzyme
MPPPADAPAAPADVPGAAVPPAEGPPADAGEFVVPEALPTSDPAAEAAAATAQPVPLRGQYDAVVVGGGLAGLVVGSLLVRAGRQVLLLEKGTALGGLCRPADSEGEPGDLGAMFLPGCGAQAALEDLARRLQLSVALAAPDPILQVALPRHRLSLFRDPERWWAEVQREFPDELPAWKALFFEMDGLVEDRANLLTLLPPVPPEGWRNRARLESVMLVRGWVGGAAPLIRRVRQAMTTPFRETLAARGFGEASQAIFDAWLWFLRLRDAGECSTLEAAVALQRLRHGLCVVSEGLGRLVERLAEQFQQDGGDLRLEAPVRRCRVERGRVVGVEMATGATTRAPRVITDLPPDALGRILPARRRWFESGRPAAGPWTPRTRGEGMALSIPEAFLPSELGTLCLVVPERSRPAREENLVMVRRLAGPGGKAAPDGVCRLEVARAVAATGPAAAPLDTTLLAALDRILPGVSEALAARALFPSGALETVWGRPAAALSYAGPDREWFGGRGPGHASGWPGLLVMGDWTYPGRLLAEGIEEAVGVADAILAHGR